MFSRKLSNSRNKNRLISLLHETSTAVTVHPLSSTNTNSACTLTSSIAQENSNIHGMKHFILFDSFFDKYIIPSLNHASSPQLKRFLSYSMLNSEPGALSGMSSWGSLTRSFLRAEMRKSFLAKVDELYASAPFLSIEPANVHDEFVYQGFVHSARGLGFLIS